MVDDDLMLSALEHAPVTAYVFRIVDGDFILHGFNAAARARSPALTAMLGRSVTLLYRDQPDLLAAARLCVNERRTLVREVVLRRHDSMEANQKQHLVFSFVDPDRMVIYAQDRDVIANVEATLADRDERYRSLVASIPDAILIRDADGRVLACNDVAAQMVGHASVADLLGQVNVLAPGYSVEDEAGTPIDAAVSPTGRVLSSGVPLRGLLLTLVRPDQSRRFIRTSIEPIRTASGGVGGSLSLHRDETARVVAERDARTNAERLELALDAARMGTWEWELGADAATWSPSVFRHFHIEGTRPGLSGFMTRLHADDVAQVRAAIDRIANADEGSTFAQEFRLLGNDELARWARLRGRVERRGQTVRVVGVIVDVTEQRRMEEELRRAHRLESLGRLAGGVAHDFNNILGAMLGSIELLEEVCPEAGREDLQTVRHGAERARDLTAQLLAFARKQPIVLEVVDLSLAIAKVDRLLRRLVGPTIRLDINAEPGLQVRADAAQLEQVLVNLVVNARDAMPNGGALDVRVRGDCRGTAEVVVLEVEDHGVGMDSSTLGRLFDPFFSTKEKGTGLGLASSYGIVQQHGGDISVDSAPGSGARFRVVLPRVREAPVRPAAPVVEAAASGRVLLVDDDDAVRATTLRLLKSLGYEAVGARDGDEAVRIARTHAAPLDIMLCDIAMPGRSGPEVARDVAQIRPDIRILFVSGYPEGGEDTVAASGFLQKPFTRAALGAKLAALRRPASA